MPTCFATASDTALPCHTERCQYLYFCTSKASKLRSQRHCLALPHSSSGVSIGTFVLIKQVTELRYCQRHRCRSLARSCQYVYFWTSKARSCQYLYFCTRRCRSAGPPRCQRHRRAMARSSSGVSICTFVRVKQVKHLKSRLFHTERLAKRGLCDKIHEY